MHPHFHWQMVQSVFVLLGIIGLAIGLRRIGMIKAEHGGLLTKLVLNVTLPALIFTSLVRNGVEVRLLALSALLVS
ncbi:MAG: hypothetical protein P9M14_17685 [Candidatus Alcyoniella australis]|nr:hypothetical protein [Candidatus Alcyoniella australis]